MEAGRRWGVQPASRGRGGLLDVIPTAPPSSLMGLSIRISTEATEITENHCTNTRRSSLHGENRSKTGHREWKRRATQHYVRTCCVDMCARKLPIWQLGLLS
jgi:hypothetical protein